ncbi:hypothetical protein Pla110_27040 [Polystyrenella longa]|uniref:DUF1963 domain-containing protein n=1 Tax=Polystyrenella longa TaxID=2528007 RepID=A0A518CP18_9PLAN|nr:YwqG family protein [Polystyrenella longa]QDU80967.1 hypothetical protein Pla110_27040 [Polystyrenella longa]
MAAENLIYDMVLYALEQNGAQLRFGGELREREANYACVRVPGVSWGDFFEVDLKEDGYIAKMPVSRIKLLEHQEKYRSIRMTSWKERDGHVQMAVPLDGSVPREELKLFIDTAYQIVLRKLDPASLYLIELANMAYSELNIIDRLIDFHYLQDCRSVIHQIARPAVLLRTMISNDATIPIGTTKIGGLPDLPSNKPWPTFKDGKPHSFLAQINLTDIPSEEKVVEGLPTEGLMSLFSVWGRMAGNRNESKVPDQGWMEQLGWTVIYHSAPNESLKRVCSPEGVQPFPAALVEPIQILSLPNSHLEQNIIAVGWNESECEKYDELQSDYRSIQMAHWFKDMSSCKSHHLLGGYALFEQRYPEELSNRNALMLLQLGSDDNAEMCWGDGGEIIFYADADALRNGRFEQIWGICQGG